MNIQNLSISLVLISVVAACGGVSESIQAADNKVIADTQKEKKSQGPQIQPEWQDKFLELFKKQPSTQKVAMALFSYGGWSNDGQILVFGEEGKGGVTMYAKPGSKAVDTTKNLAAAEFDSLSSKTKEFANLADHESGVMDGLQFEFVKAVKDEKGEVKVVQRVFMNNPGIGKDPAVQHVALVKLFQGFKPKSS